MTASFRRRFAGMPSPWLPLAIIGGLAAAVALFYLLSWALSADIVAGFVPSQVPQVFGLLGAWLAVVTVLVALTLALLKAYPLQARTLWLPHENKDLRRTGLRAARRWRKLAPLCFAPVKDDEGQKHYVGLKSVCEKSGQLLFVLRLPNCVVLTGRQALLESGAAELRFELGGAYSASVGRFYDRYGEVYLTVRDMTQDVREVAL